MTHRGYCTGVHTRATATCCSTVVQLIRVSRLMRLHWPRYTTPPWNEVRILQDLRRRMPLHCCIVFSSIRIEVQIHFLERCHRYQWYRTTRDAFGRFFLEICKAHVPNPQMLGFHPGDKSEYATMSTPFMHGDCGVFQQAATHRTGAGLHPMACRTGAANLSPQWI